MADFVYNYGGMYLWDGSYDILTEAALKAALVTSSYTEDRDDQYADSWNSNELSGTGYTSGFGNSGRQALASKTITIDLSNDRSDFDAADITWTSIDAGTAASLVLLIEDTSDAASPNISHHDFSVTTNGGDVTAQIADAIRLSTV